MNTLKRSSHLSLALDHQDPKGERDSFFKSDEPMGYNVEFICEVDTSKSQELESALKSIKDKYDHSFVNELSEFVSQNPTFERLACQIFKECSSSLGNGLVSVELRVPGMGHVTAQSSKEATITLFSKINCVHRHHNPDLTMAENKELFGKCSGLHGHEYKLEFSLRGALNDNGQVESWSNVHKIIQNKVINKYDKTYLNDLMGNTSGELIIKLFFSELQSEWPDHLKPSLTLRETLKNSFYIES